MRPTLYTIQLPRPLLFNLLLALFLGVALNLGVLWRELHNVQENNSLVLVLFLVIALMSLNLFFLTLLRGLGRWAYRILASLLTLFSVCASYYMTLFNVVVGYGVIVSTLTLDVDLSQESVGKYFIVWVIVASILPLRLIWLVDASKSTKPNHQPQKGMLQWGITLAASLLLGIAALQAVKYIKTKTAKTKNEYAASVLGVVAHRYVPTNWISGLALYGYQNISEWGGNNAKLFSPTEHFRYTAASPMEDTYVVFVIGETTRSDHMGILGYARNTTPLLSQETNVIAMRGLSCDTATKLSLRCMFVREHGTEDNDQRTLKERNVFYGLKTLGFTSELFSLQSEVWFYNSINANKYEIREVIAADPANQNKRIDDLLLVDQLSRSVASHPKGKHLVVLHTKGSHYLYSQRYPENFRIFLPECPGIDAPCGKTELVNSFDNSVRYIDHMLKNVFDQLRDKKALVFFVSDHGESIDENNHFHATPRHMAPPEQFRVPVIVWASDKFLEDPKRKEGFVSLRKRQENQYTARHEEIFDSLLGCLGYQSPDGGINALNNWCAAKPESSQ